MTSLKKNTTYSLKKKIKKALERDKEHIHGKIAYRKRRQLEHEGTIEVTEYKKNVN